MAAMWSCSGSVDTFNKVYIDLWRCHMTRKKRYSAEFKREALRRANEEGVTDVLVAEEMGFSTRQLRRWRDEAKQHGDDAFPGYGNARDKEMMLLRRKLKKVEQERDFLKEAAAYFAKESK
jgi:transposase